jgi:predicted DCC family thiol-disulfide oxidoreductase YuxK
MSGVTAQPEAAGGVHLVLYDGVCGLCNAACQFILARDRRGVFAFASLQSATGRAWLERFHRNVDALDTFYLVKDYLTSPAILEKSHAALTVAADLGAPWSWTVVFRMVPRVVRDAIYDFVARHRYQWFGRYESCLIPTPEQRARFLDV